MEVAVIIPTKNEENSLPHLLSSLKKQTFRKFKTYVCDSDSTDKTKEIAKKYGAIITKGGLPAIARDHGAREAIKKGAKILIFIDADVILPTKDFLEKSVKEFKERKLDVASTEIIPCLIKKIKGKERFLPSKDVRLMLFYSIYNLIMRKSQNGKRPFMQNYMISNKETHKKIGGFENLEFGEDSEYSKKAVEKGFKFKLLETPGKVFVSIRRFKEKGFLRMLILYLYFNARVLMGHKFIIQEKRGYFK